MKVLEISSKEFVEKQKMFFDLAIQGVQVMIKRGKNLFALTPVEDKDTYFTPEEISRIEESQQQAREGKVKEIKSIEELDRFLGLL
jgi:hypothetical protein